MKKKLIFSFLFLLFLMVENNLQGQQTLELFSLPGLSIASNSSDDVFHIYRTTTFYIKDSVINGKNYLEYHDKNSYRTFYRVDGQKVFQKDAIGGEDESLIYDFGLQIGDTIEIPMLIPPGGTVKVEFYVTAKDIVTFLDNRERIRIILGTGSWKDALEIVEGIGQFSFNKNIECVKDENGSIYLNINEAECNSVSCKNIKVEFEVEKNNNIVSLLNKSKYYEDFEWDMGDGTIYNENEVIHEFSDKGCYEISLTARNSCGEIERKSVPFENCVDSLWIVQSEMSFKDISMINDLDGFAISDNEIFKTNNAGHDWSPIEINVGIDSIHYKFSDLKMNGKFGVIVIENSDIEADVLVTENYGQVWTALAIPELTVKWKQTVSVDDEGNIILLKGTTVYSSLDRGNTWSITKLGHSSNAVANVLYQGEGGLCVITNFQQTDIDRSIINVSYDYGRSFISTSIENNRRMKGISFYGETGYITTDRGILKTEDKGVTWTEIYSFFEYSNLQDIHFSNNENGILISSNHIYRTTDGGSTWQIENCQNKFELQKLEIIDTIELIRHNEGIIKYQPENDYKCITNINESFSEPHISVFPNPTKDKLVIDIDNGMIKSIKLYSIHGVEIPKVHYTRSQRSIYVGNLPSGLYVLKVQDEQKLNHTKMFFKN